MKLQVDIQKASTEPTPEEDDIRGWITAALDTAQYRRNEAEISLRLVDIAEMTELNQNYRGKAGPTNVLSFPSDLPTELELPLLGDIAICVPVVRSEATSQGKSLEAHWAHMTVHGTLHLLGYDHIVEQEAKAMEAMESTILTKLNYPCPYRDDHTEERAAP